jgi:CheY-like chemotaxis protein
MHKLHILLAEDMAHERLAIMAGLKAALPQNVTADFTCIDYGEGAVERVKAQAFDLVILDLDFSQSPRSKGMTGLQASIQIKNAASTGICAARRFPLMSLPGLLVNRCSPVSIERARLYRSAIPSSRLHRPQSRFSGA